MEIIARLLPMIAILAGFAFLVSRARSTHFECPACGYSFKLSGSAFAIAPHVLGRVNVTCPNCGYRGLMPPIRDQG